MGALPCRLETDVEPQDIMSLARAIWWSWYPPIIGAAQVAYMLERFYRPAVLTEARCGGERFDRLLLAEEAIGYCALRDQAHLLQFP